MTRDVAQILLGMTFDPLFCTLTAQPVKMADGGDVFKLEGVIFCVDPKSVGCLGFFGGKERIQIPTNSTHSSLEGLKRHIIKYAGLKAESEKHGLGSSIELKLCRLEKSAEGSKAYRISTQAQWHEKRHLFLHQRRQPFYKVSTIAKIELFLIFARVSK